MSRTQQRNVFQLAGVCLSLGFVWAGLCAPAVGTAQEPATEEPAEEASRRRPRPWRFRPRGFTETSRTGYLFLDGEYLPSPYHFEFRDGEIFLNEADITACFPAGEAPRTGPWGRRWGGPFAGGGRFAARAALNTLNADGAAILFAGEKPVLFQGDEAGLFFAVLLGKETDRSRLLAKDRHEKFTKWLETYHAPDGLRRRFEEKRAREQAFAEEMASKNAAVRRLNQWDYPLTVLGMVLVVAALGHLMSRRPAGESAEQLNPAPEAIRQTNWSLMLVAAMSAMDLVWTILISQAGAMRELNPLGSRLLDDPIQLMIFKIGLTALAVGLIFGLRRYRRAQVASWWGCLLFTVLTVRWLTLNSLFV